MKMLAAVLEKPGNPLAMRELTLPRLRRGQVLVRVAYSGVCHSQLMEARGYRGKDPYLPHLLGHEGTGIVLRVGTGVTKVVQGDKVILGWIKARGLDVRGPVYKDGTRQVNAGAVTTFATHTIVSENRCVKLPPGVPLNVGVLFGCAIPTGAGIVFNQLKPSPDSNIAIFGLGGIGLSAVMAAAVCGCKKIIAVDIEDHKLASSRLFGATHCVNVRKNDLAKSMVDFTRGTGVDFCVEASGITSSIETAFASIRKFGGHCVFASHPAAGERISLDPYDLICGKRIEGSWGGASIPDRDIPKIARLYREGKFPLEKLLSKTYALSDINDALDDLEKRKIIRALIEIPLCD